MVEQYEPAEIADDDDDYQTAAIVVEESQTFWTLKMKLIAVGVVIMVILFWRAASKTAPPRSRYQKHVERLPQVIMPKGRPTAGRPTPKRKRTTKPAEPRKPSAPTRKAVSPTKAASPSAPKAPTADPVAPAAPTRKRRYVRIRYPGGKIKKKPVLSPQEGGDLLNKIYRSLKAGGPKR